MKIGLLTYFWENNAGQHWQAASTCNLLKNRFPDFEIEMVDVRHWKYPFEGRLPRKDFLKPWRIIRRKRAFASYESAKDRAFSTSVKSLVTNDYRKASEFVDSLGYDALITGADVILKPLDEARVSGQVPVYWLSPEIKARKAMLGSSADITKIEDLSEDVASKMKRSLSGFEFLAVRDRMTIKLLSDLGCESSLLRSIPDPTFTLAPASEWIDEAEKLFPKRRPGRKLAAVHLPNTPEAATIVETLRKKGFDVVSTIQDLGGTRWCGALTPTGWAGMSAVVDIVVTVSFHESIFALKQGRPVLAADVNRNRVDKASGLSKIRCLMEEFKLEESNLVNVFSSENLVKIVEGKIESALRMPSENTMAKCEQFKRRYFEILDELAAILLQKQVARKN